MSVESAKAFLKRLSKDEDFRKSLENAASDEERRNIVKEAGFEFTKDDLKALADSAKSELSEEELEKVAGGNALEWTGMLAVGIGGGVLGSAGYLAVIASL